MLPRLGVAMKAGWVIAGLLLSAPLLGAPPARAAGGEGIEWRPCPDEETVQCGQLDVPVDWSRPRGRRFGLAVARRPATEPKQRIGSLFVNPGSLSVDGAHTAARYALPG
ncbi:hypothetical protein GCM10022254_41760 [Actinomadura meridiana]|uniref:Alpha/beta hydrolase n=1 Tax=Actinomadura meridiana TaxID=559626 RepID=A0ABP8C7L9_9ACTN